MFDWQWINDLTETGDIYLWGDNEDGILGLHVENTTVPHHLPIEGHVIKSISCGFRHSFAVTTTGLVLAWGYERHGVLGLSQNQVVTSPTVIESFSNANVAISSISTGGMHAVAQATNGDIYSWGDGRSLKTGHATDKDITVPTKLNQFDSRIVTHISCGSATTVVAQGENQTSTFILASFKC
jgi:alpha-tubulin suppressor-like RCC1 family protein